jgi:SnoaL-like domain
VALEGLDAETLVGLYADEFSFEDAALGKTITDRTELRAYFDALFAWPDVSFSGFVAFSSADRGAAEWTWGGSRPNTRRAFAVRGASIFEHGPRGITRETIYYDPRGAVAA